MVTSGQDIVMFPDKTMAVKRIYNIDKNIVNKVGLKIYGTTAGGVCIVELLECGKIKN